MGGSALDARTWRFARNECDQLRAKLKPGCQIFELQSRVLGTTLHIGRPPNQGKNMP